LKRQTLKKLINVLKALELENKKVSVCVGNTNKNVYLSSRNLKASSVVSSLELSTYAILNANNLVL
jgi:large subunit ribosomal protein L4